MFLSIFIPFFHGYNLKRLAKEELDIPKSKNKKQQNNLEFLTSIHPSQ